MLITRTSILSGNLTSREIDVTPEQIALWEGGELLQVALAGVSAEDREFIKTGITPEEWDAMVGEEE